jgi:hypothetical protein
MKKIIYQFCFHNHRTQFEMLERIAYTLECYKEEMMDIHRYTYNLDFFKEKDKVILVDIIPHFMVPEIHSFDFDDYELESVMLEEITAKTLDFVKNNLDPEKTLVIHVVHSVNILTKESE